MKKWILLIILSSIASLNSITLEKLKAGFSACEGKKLGELCGLNTRGEPMICYESNGKGSDLICLEKM